MSIKVKIGNLVGSHESGALTRLANAALPSNTAFRLRETLEDVQKHLHQYDRDRVALLQNHAPKNEDGSWKLKEDGSADMTPEQEMAFQKELGVLLHSEIELLGGQIRRTNMFSSTSISANDLMLLSWLIPSENDEWPEQVEKAGSEV